jgi:hypothetical protein
MNKRLFGVVLMTLLIAPVSFSEAQSEKPEVLIFLGPDCPISQDYIGVLNKLRQQFPQVKFTGILPSANNKDKKLFKKEYQVEFELRSDKHKKFVKEYSIKVTPEVVLIDVTNKVRYQGAIDNWYYELGRHRPQATEHYLRDAIDDLLAEREIRVDRTVPIGCIISRLK